MMNDYTVTATQSVPEVEMCAENGRVRFQGECYPENAAAFFDPVFTWLKQFMTEHGKPLSVEFRLSYFNSSSSKFLLDLVELLDEYVRGGGQAEISWYYVPDDEDLMESGEELAADAHFPFHLIKEPLEES